MSDPTLEHIREQAAAVRDEDWEGKLAAAAAITTELGEAQQPRTAVALAHRFAQQHRPPVSLPPELAPTSLFACDWNAAREAAVRTYTMEEVQRQNTAGAGIHVMILGGRVLSADLPVPPPAPLPTQAELARDELLGLLEAIDDGDDDLAMAAQDLVAKADLSGMIGAQLKSALEQFTLALAHLQGATARLCEAMQAEQVVAQDQAQAAVLGLPADAVVPQPLHEGTNAGDALEARQREALFATIAERVEAARASGRQVNTVELGQREQAILGELGGTTMLQYADRQPWLALAYVEVDSALSLYQAR
jgi:hypothetical protein